jgi:hypothetical protein
MSNATTKAYQAQGRFTPVFFFENGKVLVSPMSFESAQQALNCQPHDARLAVSKNTFSRYHGHRLLVG